MMSGCALAGCTGAGFDPVALRAAPLPSASAAYPIKVPVSARLGVIGQRVGARRRIARLPRPCSVVGPRHDPQMVGVHAVAHAALMVDGETFGNRADEPLVSQPVREGHTLTSPSALDAPVSFGTDVAGPQPASIRALHLGFPAIPQCHANIIRNRRRGQ